MSTASDPSMSRTQLLQLFSDELTRSLADEEGAMKLVGLGIQSIPPEAVELIKDSVERLSLQQNKLSVLPHFFSRLEKLRYLDLRDNNFAQFPYILTEMHSLEILDMSVNSLEELPRDLGGLRNLNVLSLKNNKMETLPLSITQFENLRILELENNPLRPHIKAFLNNIPYKTNTTEWIQEIKTYLSTENTPQHVEQPAYTEEREIHSATQSTFQFSDPPQHQPPPLPQTSRSLERSRSTSESYVSSRAAKRMGFIIKRPAQDIPTGIIEEDEPPSVPSLDPRRNRSMSTSNVNNHSDDERNASRHTSSESADTITPNTTAGGGTSHTRSSSRGESPVGTDRLDSIPEHRSNDYFKRLSTLPETQFNLTQFKVVDISRKILFAFSEFQSTMKKLNTFCSDKQVIIEMVSQLYSSKTTIDHLVESLEQTERANEEGVVHVDSILKAVTQTVTSFKKMIDTLTSHYAAYTKNADVCFVRMLLLSLFMCYSEVYNAYMILSPDQTSTSKKDAPQLQPSMPTTTTASGRGVQLPPLRIPEHNTVTQQQLNEYSEVDEKLYESLHTVLQSSSQVYAELNDAISKSAIANANSEEYHLSTSAIQRIKELTGTCVLSMDLNKKIKLKLGSQNAGVKSPTLVEKKKFYDEINGLLKSIITILASTKAIMNESTILHEVRPSLAALTKATKDVTIMLEVSSYRLINDTFSTSSAVPQSATAMSAPMLSAIPSVMSIPQMNTPFSFATPMPTASGTSTTNPFEASLNAHFTNEQDQ